MLVGQTEEQLLKAAEKLAEEKRWSEAADLLAAENQPTDFLLDKRVWYLSRAKRCDEALSILEQLRQRRPDDFRPWFDVEPDEFDIARVQQTLTEFGSGTGLLTDAGVKAVQAAVSDCGGEYLPLWEEVERETTAGRGAAADLVRAVRTLADDFHIQLLVRLARHYQARRDDGQAVPLLEEVLRRRPDREDVAQLLITGYRETGQMTRAAQLETAYRPEFVAAQRKSEIE